MSECGYELHTHRFDDFIRSPHDIDHHAYCVECGSEVVVGHKWWVMSRERRDRGLFWRMARFEFSQQLFDLLHRRYIKRYARHWGDRHRAMRRRMRAKLA